MRTQLAPLIVVKQEYPDFRIDGHSFSEHEENNNYTTIKIENDFNNNQPNDDFETIAVKKCKMRKLF